MALKSSNKKIKTFYKVLAVLILIIFFFILYFFIYADLWKIKKIEILEAKHTDINLLKSDIDNILNQKKFFIIPNNHIILLSKKKIKKYIFDNYPSVESVDMSKNIDREIIIKIKDRKALGVWCDQNCFFFDDQGILFKESFKFTGAIFTKWSSVVSTSANFYEKAPCVEACINQEFIKFLIGNKVSKIIIDDNEDLKMYTEYGFYIKSLNNASTTMRNMNIFLGQYKENLNNLEYLDVRFEDKIYYK